MKCGVCGGIVDADSPDAAGWIRYTIDRRELGGGSSGLATVQLAQLWLCSLECVIANLRAQLRAAGEVDEAVGAVEAEAERVGITRPAGPKLWRPGS